MTDLLSRDGAEDERSAQSSAAVGDAAAAGGDTPVNAPQDKISGLSVLKGLILYGAILAFGGLYAYFIVRIFGAAAGRPPALDATEVGAAAGLAGVLGSAFALEIGTPTDTAATNPALHQALLDANANDAATHQKVGAFIRRILSLEPPAPDSASWPKTFGIWVYAVIASAVAVTDVLRHAETPDKLNVLAVAFAGYVLALITQAYGLSTNKPTPD